MPKHLSLPQTSLYTNLEVSALRYPQRDAINYYDSPLTFAQLKQQVDALAGYLQSLGVEKGDRVLLFMQNAPQFIISYYAILRANAIVVPVNPMNRAAELEHYLEDTEASVAICGQELLAAIAPVVGKVNLRHLIVAAYSDYIVRDTDLPLPPEVEAPAVALTDPAHLAWKDVIAAARKPSELLVGPDDLAVFPYSSGTTGAPKGCMHTHASVMATCVQGAVWSHGTTESVTLATLPYFHVTGMQGSMNSPIYGGSLIVLMTRWDRRVAAKLIERYKVSRWVNIVTMAIDLLSDPEVENYDLSSLENIGGGGQPCRRRCPTNSSSLPACVIWKATACPKPLPALTSIPPTVPSPSVWGSRCLISIRASLMWKPARNWRRAKWVRSLPTARRCFRVTGNVRRRHRRFFWSWMANASSAPETWGTSTKRATSSSSTGSNA
jgi:fatty-acyl-CoA synthase